MLAKNITLYIDLFFCLIILPLMVVMLPIDKWLSTDPQFVTMLVAWLYALYALHRVFTVPMLLIQRRRYIIAIAIVVFTLIVTYILTQYKIESPRSLARAAMEGILSEDAIKHMRESVPEGGRSGGHPPGENRVLRQGVWFLYMLVTAFSLVVALLSELNRQIMVRQSIEFEKKRAELSLYKAQINPHFLFNTLNTLLGLVVTKSDRAEDAIVQFTSLMRYMCNSSTQNQVALHTEVEYIEEYIALQRYRMSAHTDVQLTTSIDDESAGCQITPMLIITFVENALKYGASSQFASDIYIGISVKRGVLELTTKNPIFKGATNEQGAGIGIMNCRKRLELVYPDRYSLRIVDKGDSYGVNLTIKLK